MLDQLVPDAYRRESSQPTDFFPRGLAAENGIAGCGVFPQIPPGFLWRAARRHGPSYVFVASLVHQNTKVAL